MVWYSAETMESMLPTSVETAGGRCVSLSGVACACSAGAQKMSAAPMGTRIFMLGFLSAGEYHFRLPGLNCGLPDCFVGRRGEASLAPTPPPRNDALAVDHLPVLSKPSSQPHEQHLASTGKSHFHPHRPAWRFRPYAA